MKLQDQRLFARLAQLPDKLSTLQKLNKAGMNVARINMSHATHSSATQIINKINKINSSNDGTTSKIAILLDTQGPEIRTGDTNIPIDLNVGDEVTLTVRDEIDVETSSIKVNYKGLVHSVDVGSKITVDNGLINFKVLSKESDTLLCKVIHGGKLGSKRHVNLPGVRIDMPSITTKDIQDIQFGIKNGVDFIAASFVRTSDDLKILSDIINKKKSSSKIIAKIENQEGLDNIDDICSSAWGVMVARGDLGIETSLTDLPNIQRKIMYACAKWGNKIYSSDTFT
jgi:pyruvate kinase